MTFTLPNLPYAYDALAPHMSKETLEFHHDKHHQAYVTNGNNALKGTEFEGKSLEEIVKGSFGKNPPLFNNAGQHYNHLHFWNWMKPNGGGSQTARPAGKEDQRGPRRAGKVQDRFRRRRRRPVRLRLGLAVGQERQARNLQDRRTAKARWCTAPPRSSAVDVWEHSYYIDYRNRRPDYLKAFVDHLVNWEYVDELFGKA